MGRPLEEFDLRPVNLSSPYTLIYMARMIVLQLHSHMYISSQFNSVALTLGTEGGYVKD